MLFFGICGFGSTEAVVTTLSSGFVLPKVVRAVLTTLSSGFDSTEAVVTTLSSGFVVPQVSTLSPAYYVFDWI